MKFFRVLAAAAACLIIVPPAISLAQGTPRAVSPAASADPYTNGKIPPFLTAGGIYILDGSEDDFVKVEKLDATGWMYVQTKTGESWVNIANLTTITPISPDQVAKSQLRAKADFIRDGAQQIDDAITAYANKNNLAPTAAFKWSDIRPFLSKHDSPIYESSGKDVTGRPYQFGAKLSDRVKISPDTVKELAPVIENADTYWGAFKP